MYFVNFSDENMGNYPYCKQKISLNDIKKETNVIALLKQEIMYTCPHCENILGFRMGK